MFLNIPDSVMPSFLGCQTSSKLQAYLVHWLMGNDEESRARGFQRPRDSYEPSEQSKETVTTWVWINTY